MRKGRIVTGNITNLEAKVIKKEINSIFNENEDLLRREVNGVIEIVEVPVRKKVVLVKFPTHKYVEAVKLKTFKDIIGAYKDIINGTENYVMLPYSKEMKLVCDATDEKPPYIEADDYIDEFSLEPYYKKGNIFGHTSVRKLAKELKKGDN